MNKEWIVNLNALANAAAVLYPAIKSFLENIQDFAHKTKNGVDDAELKEMLERIQKQSAQVLEPLPPIP